MAFDRMVGFLLVCRYVVQEHREIAEIIAIFRKVGGQFLPDGDGLGYGIVYICRPI